MTNLDEGTVGAAAGICSRLERQRGIEDVGQQFVKARPEFSLIDVDIGNRLASETQSGEVVLEVLDEQQRRRHRQRLGVDLL